MKNRPTLSLNDSSNYSKRILVMIRRDMTAATPRVIWSHEKPLLEVMFGEGNVEDLNSNIMNDGYSGKISPSMLIHNKKQDAILPPSQTAGIGNLFIGDADAEYARLESAYGYHPDEKVSIVEKVYGRMQSGKFGDLLSTPSLEELPQDQLKSLILSYGVELPAGEKVDLVAIAKENGIELG